MLKSATCYCAKKVLERFLIDLLLSSISSFPLKIQIPQFFLICPCSSKIGKLLIFSYYHNQKIDNCNNSNEKHKPLNSELPIKLNFTKMSSDEKGILLRNRINEKAFLNKYRVSKSSRHFVMIITFKFFMVKCLSLI